jgi:hypothetical protein
MQVVYWPNLNSVRQDVFLDMFSFDVRCKLPSFPLSRILVQKLIMSAFSTQGKLFVFTAGKEKLDIIH